MPVQGVYHAWGCQEAGGSFHLQLSDTRGAQSKAIISSPQKEKPSLSDIKIFSQL